MFCKVGFKLFMCYLCIYLSFSVNIKKCCWNETTWVFVFLCVLGQQEEVCISLSLLFPFVHWNVACTLKRFSSRRQIFKINKTEHPPCSLALLLRKKNIIRSANACNIFREKYIVLGPNTEHSNITVSVSKDWPRVCMKQTHKFGRKYQWNTLGTETEGKGSSAHRISSLHRVPISTP